VAATAAVVLRRRRKTRLNTLQRAPYATAAASRLGTKSGGSFGAHRTHTFGGPGTAGFEGSIPAEWNGVRSPALISSDSSTEGSTLQELAAAKLHLALVQQQLAGAGSAGSERRVGRSPASSPPRQSLISISQRLSPAPFLLFNNPLAEMEEVKLRAAPPPVAASPAAQSTPVAATPAAQIPADLGALPPTSPVAASQSVEPLPSAVDMGGKFREARIRGSTTTKARLKVYRTARVPRPAQAAPPPGATAAPAWD